MSIQIMTAARTFECIPVIVGARRCQSAFSLSPAHARICLACDRRRRSRRWTNNNIIIYRIELVRECGVTCYAYDDWLSEANRCDI